jgi:hypothetical protein
MRSHRLCAFRRGTRRSVAAFLATALAASAGAQTILDDDHTIASIQTGVPVEHDFQVAAAGTYTVTVTDFGEQAPVPTALADLQLAVTANDAIVGTPVVIDGTGASTTTPGVGSVTFVAPSSATYPVTYRLHVVGVPASGNGPGPIGTVVTNSSGAAACSNCSWGDEIALPSQALPATEALLSDQFTVAASGSYQVSLTDLALPQALQSATLILLQVGASSPLVTLAEASNNNPAQGTVSLTSGVSYQIYAIGAAATGATGGLYSVAVTPTTGPPAYSQAVPIGTTTQLGFSTILQAGSYALSLADLQFPAALSQVAVAAVMNAQPAAQLTSGGTAAFSVTSAQTGTNGATVLVFGAATPATNPGEGSYVAQITPTGAPPVFSAAQGVALPGSAVTAYAFTATIPADGAGTYTATLTDFQFPAPLTVAELGLVQNSSLLGEETATGSFNATTAAGPVTLIAFAEGGLGGSLSDISLANSGGTLLLDQPQGVGAAFSVTKISIPSTGTYQFSLLDLGWPAPFGTIAGVLTQGGTKIGQIVGGGAINSTQLNEADYYLSIIATPANGSVVQAGTYALNVSTAPAAPTVTLTSDNSTVTSGGTVHLIWTTTGATSCVGSGGSWTTTYTGAQAASDSVTSPALSSTQTFTLSCTGAGGTTAKSVTITVTAAAASHGGGAMDTWLLTLLSYLALRRRSRQSASRA